jgi:hypothetical protein
MNKKGFLKSQIEKVEQALWNQEFLLYEWRQMKEERRKQRDRCMESLDALEQQLKNKDNKEETIKVLEEKKAEQVKYKEKVEYDLANVDLQINGMAPTEAVPQGFNGVLTQIDSLRERMKMLKDYIKQI